jgi:hypothetical protein
MTANFQMKRSINLQRKWALTNKQVADYATKISEGVTPSDLWPTPGNQAAKSWKDALAALNAYIAASGAKISISNTSQSHQHQHHHYRNQERKPSPFKPAIPSTPGVKKPGDPGFIGPVASKGKTKRTKSNNRKIIQRT